MTGVTEYLSREFATRRKRRMDGGTDDVQDNQLLVEFDSVLFDECDTSSLYNTLDDIDSNLLRDREYTFSINEFVQQLEAETAEPKDLRDAYYHRIVNLNHRIFNQPPDSAYTCLADDIMELIILRIAAPVLPHDVARIVPRISHDHHDGRDITMINSVYEPYLLLSLSPDNVVNMIEQYYGWVPLPYTRRTLLQHVSGVMRHLATSSYYAKHPLGHILQFINSTKNSEFNSCTTRYRPAVTIHSDDGLSKLSYAYKLNHLFWDNICVYDYHTRRSLGIRAYLADAISPRAIISPFNDTTLCSASVPTKIGDLVLDHRSLSIAPTLSDQMLRATLLAIIHRLCGSRDYQRTIMDITNTISLQETMMVATDISIPRFHVVVSHRFIHHQLEIAVRRLVPRKTICDLIRSDPFISSFFGLCFVYSKRIMSFDENSSMYQQYLPSLHQKMEGIAKRGFKYLIIKPHNWSSVVVRCTCRNRTLTLADYMNMFIDPSLELIPNQPDNPLLE